MKLLAFPKGVNEVPLNDLKSSLFTQILGKGGAGREANREGRDSEQRRFLSFTQKHSALCRGLLGCEAPEPCCRDGEEILHL